MRALAQEPRAKPEDEDPKLAGRFVGRVVGPDDRPVGGARIYVAPNQPLPTKAGPVRAMSGADGRFEFNAPDMTYTELDGLPARRQGLLIATADGYAPDWMVTWGETRGGFRSHSDPVKGADATLRLGRDDVPIHGRLLDQGGIPIGGARVRILAVQIPWKRDLDAHLQKFEGPNHRLRSTDYERSLNNPTVLPGVDVETTTDADGRFRLSGLGRDRLVDLLVTEPRVVETRLTVMTRDAADVVIDRDAQGNPTRSILGAGFSLRMQPGRTISGTVRDPKTHEAIAGMWVGRELRYKLKHEHGYLPATSDSGGRFTISGIDPAESKVELMAVPQPGQPRVAAKATVGTESEITIESAGGFRFD